MVMSRQGSNTSPQVTSQNSSNRCGQLPPSTAVRCEVRKSINGCRLMLHNYCALGISEERCSSTRGPLVVHVRYCSMQVQMVNPAYNFMSACLSEMSTHGNIWCIAMADSTLQGALQEV